MHSRDCRKTRNGRWRRETPFGPKVSGGSDTSNACSGGCSSDGQGPLSVSRRLSLSLCPSLLLLHQVQCDRVGEEEGGGDLSVCGFLATLLQRSLPTLPLQAEPPGVGKGTLRRKEL